jgi:hypothetical protein
MALSDSSKAIGAVTRLLTQRLTTVGLSAQAGRPDKISSTFTGVNLFLYEVTRNAALANESLFEGEPPPLWLTLHFLLNAAHEGETDTPEAHDLLGQAMAALQRQNFLNPTSGSPEELALEHANEPLKITFEPSASDVTSKITQSGVANERYRLGIAFEVRPIVIAPEPPQKFDFLVGIDYTQPPPNNLIEGEGLGLQILPTMGPQITRVNPERLSHSSTGTFTVEGVDLHLSGLQCCLSGAVLTLDSQQPSLLKVRTALTGLGLSAGEHVLYVTQPLLGGKTRQSNKRLVRVLPTVTSVTLVASTLTVTGQLLGGAEDDVWIALLRNGQVLRVIEGPATAVTQDQLTATLTALPPGPAHVVVRVNGQQAHQSPVITI